MSANTIKNSTEVIVQEDEEDYETIIYHGRSITDESNSTYTSPKNTKALCNGTNESDSISCTPAQASAHDLESPDFVRKNFIISSSMCSRSSLSSSGTSSRFDLPTVQLERTPKQTAVKLPFGFPQMATKEGCKQKQFQENVSYLQERVEIINDIKKDIEETAWENWPKKYIEESGFSLGVQPGNFYKSSRGPYFYVTMPHRSSYEILVTNNKQIPCNVDVYVDGKLVAALRLPAGVSNTIDGPMYSEFAFKLFRSRDAPPHLGIVEGNHENGIIKAIFTPQKVEAFEERSVSRPLSFSIPFQDKSNCLRIGSWTYHDAKNEGTITASSSDTESCESSESESDSDPSCDDTDAKDCCQINVQDTPPAPSRFPFHGNEGSWKSVNYSLEGLQRKRKTYGEIKAHSWSEQNMNEVVEGVTVLQGIKKKQLYLPAPQMETDVSKQVILILRLVASNKEEIEASNEKVSSLEPPPVPSRR
ncbi:uncharacterized protein LOC118185660 isoform X2 [Stegodyphus dumicola]|nr:uncharacterized protein LOC118185660 isoform X2 [Stegodyphus dumicola]